MSLLNLYFFAIKIYFLSFLSYINIPKEEMKISILNLHLKEFIKSSLRFSFFS